MVEMLQIATISTYGRGDRYRLNRGSNTLLEQIHYYNLDHVAFSNMLHLAVISQGTTQQHSYRL